MRGMFGWPLGTPRVQEAHCCGPLERESKTHSPPFNYVELSLVPVGRREGGRAQAGARGVGRRTDEHVMDWLTEVEKSALPPHFLMSSIPRGALHLQRNSHFSARRLPRRTPDGGHRGGIAYFPMRVVDRVVLKLRDTPVQPSYVLKRLSGGIGGRTGG